MQGVAAAPASGSIRLFTAPPHRDGGVKWSRSWIVATGEEYPIWGPVLHSDGPKLWLFYSASTHNCTVPNRDDWRSPGGDIMAITSEDGAKTWSVPRTLFMVLLCGVSSSVARLTTEFELGTGRS